MKEILIWFFTAESSVTTPLVTLKMPPAGLVVYFGLQLYGAWWAFRDAIRRDKTEWLVGLLTLVYWPVFLLIWLWLRPPVGNRTLERRAQERRRERGLLDPRDS